MINVEVKVPKYKADRENDHYWDKAKD